MPATAMLDPLLLGAMHTNMDTIIVSPPSVLPDKTMHLLTENQHLNTIVVAESSSRRSSRRRPDPRLRARPDVQLLSAVSD